MGEEQLAPSLPSEHKAGAQKHWVTLDLTYVGGKKEAWGFASQEEAEQFAEIHPGSERGRRQYIGTTLSEGYEQIDPATGAAVEKEE